MPGHLPYSSLGGQPIISAASTVQEFIANDWDWSAIYRRANSYSCKVGSEPGMAYILMQGRDLKLLDSRQPQDLKLGVGDDSVLIKNLTILQAQSLLPFGTRTPDSLYLVTLADCRYFLKRTTISKRYNIRSTCSASAWCEGTINEDDPEDPIPYTFAQIVVDIATDFSAFGGFFPFNSDWATRIHETANLPTKNPENLRFEGISAWDALEQLCQQCGFFLRYNPLVGDVLIMKIGLAADPVPGADGDYTSGFGGGRSSLVGVENKFALTPKSTTRSANDDLAEDTEIIIGSALVPHSINVIFPTNDANCGEFCAIDENHGWYFRRSVTAARVKELLDAQLADAGDSLTGDTYAYIDQTIAGTSVTLNSTYYARFTESNDSSPVNLSDLITVAEQMAVDYYRTLGYQANGRVVFNGVRKVIPGPTISEVIWREWGDGLKTEFARWPLPVGLPRVPKVFSGGGGGTIRVVFLIDSYDADTGIALCTVRYRPCGLSEVPGETGGQIEVIDPAGCVFNEDPYDLVGRWGWADYMVEDGDSYQDCVWVTSGICCP